MNVSLKHLLYVVTAANERSIARAAEKLRISPSAVAAAIGNVEQDLALRLFIRRPAKGLVLTRSGRSAVARAKRLLDEVDAFEMAVSGIADALSGELNVGCFAPIAPMLMPPIIQAVTSRYPRVSVHLHEGNLDRVQQYLRDGTVEIVLSYDLDLGADLEYETLTEAPPHVLLAAADPMADRESISLEELADRPMVLLDLPLSRNYFQTLFEAHGYRPNVVHRTGTYEMVRCLVAAGLGYSLLNMRPSIDETYGGNRVVCRPLADNVRAPRFVLAYASRGRPIRIVQIFAETCHAYFRSGLASRFVVVRDQRRIPAVRGH